MSRLNIGVYAPMNMNRFAGDSVRIMELLSGLRSLGVKATAIIPEGGNPSVSSRFEPALKFRIPSSSNPFLNYAFCSLLTQYLVPKSIFDGSFDLVQVEGSYAFPLSKLRNLAHRSNVLFDMHSIASIDLLPYVPKAVRGPIEYVVHEAQDFLCQHSKCLVVSDSMKRYILNRLGVDSTCIHVIPNGVNLDIAEKSMKENRGKFEYLRNGVDLLLVYVGGLEWYEGVDLLIRALLTIRKCTPQVRLAIAGRGSEEKTLQRLVLELDLKKHVVFLGWLKYEHTFALQSVADILVAPRKPLCRDGFDISTPVKIPSYLTAGRPIVTSRVGEIPMVARHQREAVLVRHPTPDTFGNCILDLWADSARMELLSQNCTERAKEYSWRKIAAKLLDIYEDIMND